MSSGWLGPYIVLDRKDDVNYLLSTPEGRTKTKLVHVDLIRRFIDRPDKFNIRENLKSQLLDTIIRNTDLVTTCNVQLDARQDMLSEESDNVPGHIHDITRTEPFSPSEQHDIDALLLKFDDIFSDTPGLTPLGTHKIQRKPGASPIRKQSYRLNPAKAEESTKEIDKLLTLGIIRPSESHFASPCIIVPKKDGTRRLVIDYIRVNPECLQQSAFPLPRIDDLIDRVGQAKYLTKLDIRKTYWNVGMHPDSISLTAWVSPSGHWEFLRLPFGICSAPACFSRIINRDIKKS